MPREYTVYTAVHGTAFHIEYPGPSYMNNVEGVDWTDQQGLRRGWGLELALDMGKENFVHIPVQTITGFPSINNGREQQMPSWSISRIQVDYEIRGTQSDIDIWHCGVFRGKKRIISLSNRPRLNQPPAAQGLNVFVANFEKFTLADRYLDLDACSVAIGLKSRVSGGRIVFYQARFEFAVSLYNPGDTIPVIT